MSTTSVGRLNKRHAILTGAGGGIGAAVAAAFLREGALCTIVDLAAQPSQAVQELAAQYPGQVLYVGADLTKAAERERVVAEGVAKFYHGRAQSGAMSEDEAKKSALAALSTMIYSSSN